MYKKYSNVVLFLKKKVINGTIPIFWLVKGPKDFVIILSLKIV